MNAAVAQERWQGQIVDGKFPLLEWLGGSANTSVFRTELPTQQAAAIKLIRADTASAAQQIGRWKESAALSHSNLLRIFDTGFCQITGAHWLYVVTECAEENLDQVVPIRPLSTAEVAELLPPAVEALRFLHAKGLVHGRIKPSNIFAVNNQLKLSIDSVQATEQKATEHGLSAYDAPEAESGVLSGASDIWSLGMMLVTAFNQRPVTFSRASLQNVAVPKSVPEPYSQIATECLRVKAEERCSLARINQLLSRGPALTQPAPLPKAVAKTPSKRKIAIPIAIAVVAAAIIFAVMSRHSNSSSPQAPTIERRTESAAPSADTPKVPAEGPRASPSSTHHASADGIVSRVTPQVPLSARETIQGKVKVKVRVSVNADGQVSSASLVSPGPSRYFARLALGASEKWKFARAEGNGQPNRQWMLEYRFGRASTEVTPVEFR